MQAVRGCGRSAPWGIVLLMAVTAPAASAFSVHGEATVAVTGSSASSDLTEPSLVGDSIAVSNANSAASAWYTASLASATLSSYASAAADPATAYGSGANAQVAPVSFVDTLSFHVPAGTYATGLGVRFEGFTLGSLLALGCRPTALPVCSNGYHAVHFYAGGPYGSDTYQARADVDAGTTSSGSMDAFFVLDLPIMNSTTLTMPTDVQVSVTGSITTRGAALNTYGYSGDLSTLFTGDLFAGFTRLETPANVTWTSDSGLFLSLPVAEPPSMALMLAGAAAIALLVARRRSHGV